MPEIDEQDAIAGAGIRIFHNDADTMETEPTIEVTGIRDVTPPSSGKSENKEVTSHAFALAKKKKKYKQGLSEPSDWSYKMIYDPVQFAELTAIKDVQRGWKVVFSDGSYYLSESTITELKTDAPMDGFIEAEITLFNGGDIEFHGGDGS